MSEVWRIVLTASITVAGGVIVYFLGHLFVALFVEPIHRLRTLIGEIADSLVFYANVYSNPGYGQKEEMDKASEILRRQASQLRARAHSIPWYSLWSLMKLVRKRAETEKASGELIGLSNSIHRSEPNLGVENHRRREKIEELLGIRGSEKRKQDQTINWHIMSDGVLLFIFGLLLLAVKEVSETPTWGLIPILGLIPPPPVFFSIALRIILIAISLILMIAILWRWQAYKRANSLKGRLKKAKYLIIFSLFLLPFIICILFVLWLIPPLPVCVYTALGIFAVLISLVFIVAVFCERLASKLEKILTSQFSYIYWVIFLTVFLIGFAQGLSHIPLEGFGYWVAFCVGFVWFLFIPFAWFKFIFQRGK